MTAHRTARLLAICFGLAFVLAPGTAYADAAEPTNWRSEIVSVTPASEVVSLSIEGGDAFVRIDVAPGHEVVIEGYAGEPYIWIDAAGTVHENGRSPATYLNRDMSGTASVPDLADPESEPDWERVADGGAWSWHDHRAHYMGGAPPPSMQAGESLPDTRVPIVVDGIATEVAVRTTLVASPSPWPAVAGALIALALVAATVLLSIPASAAMLPIAIAASWLGVLQYASLPAETGPRLIWWVPAVIAVACGIADLLVPRRATLVRCGLLLIGAAQLFVWGFVRRGGMTHAVLPTSAPFWLDRLVTAAALAGGAVLFGIAVYDLVRATATPQQPEVREPTLQS
jgi:hypothetical protein